MYSVYLSPLINDLFQFLSILIISQENIRIEINARHRYAIRDEQFPNHTTTMNISTLKNNYYKRYENYKRKL